MKWAKNSVSGRTFCRHKSLGGQHHNWYHRYYYLVCPKRRYPKSCVFIWIYIRSVSEVGGQEGGVIGGCWGLLTADIENSVIHDIVNILVRTQGRLHNAYTESFVSLFFFWLIYATFEVNTYLARSRKSRVGICDSIHLIDLKLHFPCLIPASPYSAR